MGKGKELHASMGWALISMDAARKVLAGGQCGLRARDEAGKKEGKSGTRSLILVSGFSSMTTLLESYQTLT